MCNLYVDLSGEMLQSAWNQRWIKPHPPWKSSLGVLPNSWITQDVTIVIWSISILNMVMPTIPWTLKTHKFSCATQTISKSKHKSMICWLSSLMLNGKFLFWNLTGVFLKALRMSPWLPQECLPCLSRICAAHSNVVQSCESDMSEFTNIPFRVKHKCAIIHISSESFLDATTTGLQIKVDKISQQMVKSSETNFLVHPFEQFVFKLGCWIIWEICIKD